MKQEIEKHAFSDANAKAYGLAVYAKSGKVVTLLFAEARVAPAKALSSPKLELLAAAATVALQFVEKSLGNECVLNQFLWRGSMCIIGQIRTTCASIIHTERSEGNSGSAQPSNSVY